MSTTLYDPKCKELADFFLDEEEHVTSAERADLAGTIQQAIEDWLFAREGKL